MERQPVSEHQVWRAVYGFVMEQGKTHSFRRKQISDAWVVLVFLWSVLKDRPRCWACDPRNWPKEEQSRPLPSPTTLGRRLRTVPVLQLLEQVERRLRELFGWGPLKIIDSKPLPVGGYTKDRDARYGRGAGTMDRGYRIHAMRDGWSTAAADCWRLAPMNGSDPVEGEALLAGWAARLAAGAVAPAAVRAWGYLPGDNAYDSNRLYDLAAAVNLQLVAPPRANAKGLGHVRQSPGRLRGLELSRQPHPLNPLCRPEVPRSFGQELLHQRGAIERTFGLWGNWGGGMGQLPNWVRRPRRVALWVEGKLIFNAAREALATGLLPLKKQRLAA